MHRITAEASWPLHGLTASRQLEQQTQAALPPHTLMQRAGLAIAQLARALAPHGRHVWIACGPGNNGGDGFEAARHLLDAGWQVSVTWLPGTTEPADAMAARHRAQLAGLRIQAEPPLRFDLAIDALLGLGGDLSEDRPGTASVLRWLAHMSDSGQPVLAVDLPSGLNGQTGHGGLPVLRRPGRHTLSLLTLKPGLFTAQGRDQAGQVWLDTLGADLQAVPATAELLGADHLPQWSKLSAPHDSHKGRYGDVMVVGGVQTPGPGTHMVGAALLAARAALRSGAGRVYVALLGQPELRTDPGQPELMFRPLAGLRAMPPELCMVCGCGAGDAAADALAHILAEDHRLVLDADALNALAADRALRRQWQRRRPAQAVLTPHPLEAARLLGCSAADVQADRLRAAQTLADEWGCTVVLKGSGTVIAAPGQTPCINPTGNALLATAGTGDVLAGMVGAALAVGLESWAAAQVAVHRHGALAQAWAQRHPLTPLCAGDLLEPDRP
jgi:ADP-dependent NAD(P)H-hydrate dehydratase / NAD(P)H-hydrate epimerase